MTMQWGILGPGTIESVRRVRTLDLTPCVRLFNELAVPGLGGVWFGKQLFLATLGVLVAEQANERGCRVTKITVANAIEAIACWLALTGEPRTNGGRVLGSTKLVGHDSYSFSKVSQSNFYVTTPMRMSTVMALPALGLVEASGNRFNSFTCSRQGLELVEAACQDSRPFNRSVVEHLVQWVCGQDDRVDSGPLRAALSPLTPLPLHARLLIQARLHQGASREAESSRRRRSDALRWVASRREAAPPVSWDSRPVQISTPEHWVDLHAGALFFAVRDAALDVLNVLEIYIGTPERKFAFGTPIPARMQDALTSLKTAALAFLDLKHHSVEAREFCRECTSASAADVLSKLVGRDGRILRLVGTSICPGPAFHGGEQSEVIDPEPNEAPEDTHLDWPDGISHRISNLWWLSLDLDGEIEAWLNPENEEATHG